METTQPYTIPSYTDGADPAMLVNLRAAAARLPDAIRYAACWSDVAWIRVTTRNGKTGSFDAVDPTEDTGGLWLTQVTKHAHHGHDAVRVFLPWDEIERIKVMATLTVDEDLLPF